MHGRRIASLSSATRTLSRLQRKGCPLHSGQGARSWFRLRLVTKWQNALGKQGPLRLSRPAAFGWTGRAPRFRGHSVVEFVDPLQDRTVVRSGTYAPALPDHSCIDREGEIVAADEHGSCPYRRAIGLAQRGRRTGEWRCRAFGRGQALSWLPPLPSARIDEKAHLRPGLRSHAWRKCLARDAARPAYPHLTISGQMVDALRDSEANRLSS
jgi:hypothetical protein